MRCCASIYKGEEPRQARSMLQRKIQSRGSYILHESEDHRTKNWLHISYRKYVPRVSHPPRQPVLCNTTLVVPYLTPRASCHPHLTIRTVPACPSRLSRRHSSSAGPRRPQRSPPTLHRAGRSSPSRRRPGKAAHTRAHAHKRTSARTSTPDARVRHEFVCQIIVVCRGF